MQLDHAFIIAKREYLTRVKTKGFWIATIGLPVIMFALAAGPAILMSKTETNQRLAIVDQTGGGLGQQVAAALAAQPGTAAAPATGRRGEGNGNVHFNVEVQSPAPDAAAQRKELDDRVLRKEIDAWVWLDNDDLAKHQFEYHADSLANFVTQAVLERSVSRVVSKWKLRQAGFDSAKIDTLTQSLDLQPFRISITGSHAEGGLGSFAVAIGLFLILYMTLIIHGTQIMQGVIEEKSSRVIEVITSAVRPTELMAGKLAGICLLALTQLAIWLGTALVLSSPGLLAAFVARPLEIPTVAPAVVANFIVLFLLGFFLFATIYAMIGAAFNSVQEAQQVASIVIFLVVAPMLFFMPVLNDPDGRLAVVTSLIPFFTPLVMTLRIASKMPPAWQLALAYFDCLLTIAAMVWLCSRIYRVGILMYGKKPTLQEIWRWVRYA